MAAWAIKAGDVDQRRRCGGKRLAPVDIEDVSWLHDLAGADAIPTA
jgi:hypothetical protein